MHQGRPKKEFAGSGGLLRHCWPNELQNAIQAQQAFAPLWRIGCSAGLSEASAPGRLRLDRDAQDVRNANASLRAAVALHLAAAADRGASPGSS
jgi:hypothetical protein